MTERAVLRPYDDSYHLSCGSSSGDHIPYDLQQEKP